MVCFAYLCFCSVQDRDCLSDSGMRYDYARLEREDARIVYYNKELLTAWDGHINVQRVTQLWPGEVFGQVCVKSGAHLYDQRERE